MAVGYDQDMGAGSWMSVPEGCNQVILVEHPFGCPTLDNLTENTRRSPALPSQYSDDQEMDERIAVYKNSQTTWFLHPG